MLLIARPLNPCAPWCADVYGILDELLQLALLLLEDGGAVLLDHLQARGLQDAVGSEEAAQEAEHIPLIEKRVQLSIHLTSLILGPRL